MKPALTIAVVAFLLSGLAVADSPDGPWKKSPQNLLNVPTRPQYAVDDPKNFDSFRVCDVCWMIRNGSYTDDQRRHSAPSRNRATRTERNDR